MKGNCFRRITGVLLALLMMVTICVPVLAAPPDMYSDYYVLMDVASGQILASKNADSQLPPAGLVKILTGLVAAENIADDTIKLTVTSSALAPLGTGVKNISLAAGEMITMADCMNAMLMVSANDAANVVAESVCTTLDSFMTMISNRAIALGATSTVLKNPNGLNADGQVSTPHDLALIARAAISNETFMKYFGKVSYTLEPTNRRAEAKVMNTSFLMLRDGDYYYEGTLGGMVGYTNASKYVAMATAERNGRQLIAVVMSAETEAELYHDAIALLDHGFNDFTTAAVPNDLTLFVADLAKDGMKIGSVEFRLRESVSLLLSTDYDTSKILVVPNSVPAVITAGSSQEYTANIVYRVNPDNIEQDILLMADVVLASFEEINASVNPEDPTASTPISTDSNGEPAATTPGSTDSTGDEEGDSFFVKVLKVILKIVLYILLTVVILAVLFIAFLFILREIKRRKKRKARQARMQQRYHD